MNRFIYTLLIIFSIASSNWASITIKIDPEEQNSFPFPVSAHIFDEFANRIFIGANQAIADSDDKLFAVSFADAEDTIFTGITPEKIRLNGIAESTNPLHGSKIRHLALFGRRPIVVLDDEPASLYVINKFLRVSPVEVLGVKDLKDADGNITAGIAAITSNAPGRVMSLPENNFVFDQSDKFEGSSIFAAVKKSGGVFGEKGSGVVLIQIFNVVDEETKGSKIIISVPNLQQQVKSKKEAEKDASEKIEKKIDELSKEQKKENDTNLKQDTSNTEQENNVKKIQTAVYTIQEENCKAAPLDGETEAVRIGSPVSLDDAVTFHNSFRLGTYIGLQGAAGSQAEDGIRSLVRVVISAANLGFREVAPASAFSGNDKIVGAVGSFEHVSIKKINSMLTSTWLDYLIVVGGNGDAVATNDQVYALPIVGRQNPSQRGAIAKKDSIPKDVRRMNTDRFAQRSFIIAARSPEDMPCATDRAARVGGGPLGMPIEDIVVKLDTVFVATGQSADGQQPGIFYSQALFDEFGRIANWTSWERAGTVGPIFGLAFDAVRNSFFFMTGASADAVFKVRRTVFGKVNFTGRIGEAFPQENGGVQSIVEFPYDTSGFSSEAGERLSIIAWLGNGKVLFSQNGADDSANNFGPIHSFGTFTSEDGTLSNFSPDLDITNLAISGGALMGLGAITSSAVVVAGNQGYFVVGGFGGIAVLSRNEGEGFDALSGLQSRFFGLDNSFSFKKITEFRRIRKLIAENGALYIATDKTIERVVLTPQGIESGNIMSVKLSDGSNLEGFGENDTFSDIVISHGFAIIATSAGLYYARSVDIASNMSEVHWQRIELADSLRSSTRLLARGPKEGFDNHGMVYVLNAYVGAEQARIYRLIVDSSSTQPIKKVPDLFFIHDGPTFFVNLDSYKNYFATDGASTFIMRSRNLFIPVLFEAFTPGLRSGLSIGERKQLIINLDIDDARAIGPMIRSMTSGAWIVVGDFGVRGNE